VKSSAVPRGLCSNGAGGGQNFPFYDPTRVQRVEAVESDAAMSVEGITLSTGVLQAAMPTAVLASIIAVLFSTIASVVTLTVVLAIV
jgi:hypothetical protein